MFSAVCPKGPFWVQRSLLLTQKTWQMLSVGVNLVITCMLMTRNSWGASVSLRFRQSLRHCSAVSELQGLTDHDRAFRCKLKTFLFNVHLLHSDSLAAGHLGVSDGQSESESDSSLNLVTGLSVTWLVQSGTDYLLMQDYPDYWYFQMPSDISSFQMSVHMLPMLLTQQLMRLTNVITMIMIIMITKMAKI